MKIKSSDPLLHVGYWIFVILTLTLVFGLSWGNNMAAFYFVSMLLPVVLGTSYFFNYVLVPRFFLRKKLFRFGLYSLYTLIVSLYLESLVMMFSIIYLVNFKYQNLPPNSTDTLLLAIILYLLVFVGSLLLMARQVREKQTLIRKLLAEQQKLKRSVLEVMSNRKKVKIDYEDILYIESLADYIQIHTSSAIIASKEKISHLQTLLPEHFVRIHRSFIVNADKIREYSNTEVNVDGTTLNIGRNYKKEALKLLINR